MASCAVFTSLSLLLHSFLQTSTWFKLEWPTKTSTNALCLPQIFLASKLSFWYPSRIVLQVFIARASSRLWFQSLIIRKRQHLFTQRENCKSNKQVCMKDPHKRFLHTCCRKPRDVNYIKWTISRQPTIVEECSVQVVVHEAGKMPHRPKEYDHPLAPCNLAFKRIGYIGFNGYR
jgi:hypothetical protein